MADKVIVVLNDASGKEVLRGEIDGDEVKSKDIVIHVDTTYKFKTWLLDENKQAVLFYEQTEDAYIITEF